MPPISARSSATADPGQLHLLWRSGVGMALWLSEPPAHDTPAEPSSGAAPAELGVRFAEPFSSLLAGKRVRHRIAVINEDGLRDFVAAATLGVASTAAFLDATRAVSVSGEVRWYRTLLDGIRRFVAAGAVAPGLTDVGGETMFRWQVVPTPSWRSWLTVMIAAAPGLLESNGGRDAIADLVAELVDHQCRARIAMTTPTLGVPAPATALIAALVGDAAIDGPARHPASHSAWMQWSNSAPQDDSLLLFRLYEPEEDSANHTTATEHWDTDTWDTDTWETESGDTESRDSAAESRWRLQVCRRTPDGSVSPVAPHRLDAHDLDRATTDLAAAVRAFPELARTDPDRASLDFLLPLDTVEALLDHGATALGDAGFPVLLPRTIAEVRPTLGVRAVGVPGGGAPARMVGLHEIREFEWRLALDPDTMTLTDGDLDELARQKGDLVRIRGVWLRAESGALGRAATFILTQRRLAAAGQPVDMGELFGLIADGTDRVPVPVTTSHGLAWLDEIADGGILRPTTVPAPQSLTARLRPYQQRGLEWLAYLTSLGVGGVLADDMGLGKTVQVIALLCHEHELPTPDSDHTPTLIVCPMSVVGNWARELERFAPNLRVVIHHGTARATRNAFEEIHRNTDVVITTFAIATRDRELLSSRGWRRVVVDEAQHIKNVNTAAAKAIRALNTRHRLALTGTPVENRLEDLRAVIDLVNPGVLGTASTFRARFAEPIERDRDPDALRRLTRLTRPFILRREKSDPAIISDLPEKTELTVRANLTLEQAALYRAIIDELMRHLRDRQQRALRRQTVLAALTRLKQVCNHPAHYLADGTPMMHRGQHRSGKVELLCDILTTLTAEGDRALVFTQFAKFGELLSAWLGDLLGTEVPLLHGGLGRSERDRLVARFSDGGDAAPPIMLATLKAGGTGLNLTAANHVVHVDRWWNPAVEDQATDRAYRIGQTQRVHVRRFVCVGTLEERVDDLIARKRELSRLTVATGESWMSDLGDDELFDLFALRDDAVSQ